MSQSECSAPFCLCEDNEDCAASMVCDHCDGTGEVWEICGCYQCEYSGEHSQYVPCLNCDGRGTLRGQSES